MVSPESAPAPRDAWAELQRHTSARIALGRAGGSLRSASLLDFRFAHARARDAVQMDFDAGVVEDALRAANLPSVRLSTNATDRRAYLVRPDLGRQLSSASREALLERRRAWGARDLAIIVSDGLSALAAERQAAATTIALLKILAGEGWSFFPVFVVPFARVKLQDEIGELLDARHALILLGERPGLGAPDSLGAYFTYRPRAACSDADRNCVSNIRPEGFAPAPAACKLAQLLLESARRRLSGVALKDAELPALAAPLVGARDGDVS